MEDQIKSRFYALDSLKASLMILVVIAHASLSYISIPFRWFVNDPEKSIFFDVLVFFIQTFSMAVFFILSGFFARLLHKRVGVKGFVKNRGRKMLIPFLFALVLTIPFLQLMYLAGDYVLGEEQPFSVLLTQMKQHFTLGKVWDSNPIMHLWFLYYLMLFYLLQVMISRYFGKYIPSKWLAFINSFF